MTTTTLGTLLASLIALSSGVWPPIGKVRIEPASAGLGDQVDRRDEEVAARARPGVLEPGRIPEAVACLREGRAQRQIRIESVDHAHPVAHDEEDRGAVHDSALVHDAIARPESLDKRRRQRTG